MQPWALSLPDKELCLREALAVCTKAGAVQRELEAHSSTASAGDNSEVTWILSEPFSLPSVTLIGQAVWDQVAEVNLGQDSTPFQSSVSEPDGKDIYISGL